MRKQQFSSEGNPSIGEALLRASEQDSRESSFNLLFASPDAHRERFRLSRPTSYALQALVYWSPFRMYVFILLVLSVLPKKEDQIAY